MTLPLNNQTPLRRTGPATPENTIVLMKPIMISSPPRKRLDAAHRVTRVLLTLTLLLPSSARASIFEGEALDKVADVLTWIVLVIAPIVAVGVFLLIHILPEKIAEKKQHPQTKAIQCLCLLSLFFGGILWPLAWLWAYTKPTLYKLAYGTDKVAHGHEEVPPAPAPANAEEEELQELKNRIAELEIKLHNNNHNHVGKA
jgi:CBS domain containing-hemolysin-like protein